VPHRKRESVVPARLRGDDGFTLVESVVSIALFVILAAAATFAIVSAARAAEATALRVSATQIAQQQLERAVALGPDPSTPPEDGTVESDGRSFDIRITAEPAYGEDCGGGSRDISVVVGSATVSVRLDTRLACAQAVPGVSEAGAP